MQSSCLIFAQINIKRKKEKNPFTIHIKQRGCIIKSNERLSKIQMCLFCLSDFNMYSALLSRYLFLFSQGLMLCLHVYML